MLVRYLSLKTDVGMSSTARIMRLPSLTRLQVLSVREDVPRAPLHLSSSMQPFPAPNLTHLLYQGGNTHLLGHLLTLLPHLQSLHVGRFNYSSSRLQSPPDTRITCKLREVVFQSVYHYNKDHFDWLFGTSKDSIQYLTVANYGSLLYDLADYFHNARYVELTVKNNLFEVPEDPEQYQLSFLLQRFEHLESVSMLWPYRHFCSFVGYIDFSFACSSCSSLLYTSDMTGQVHGLMRNILLCKRNYPVLR
jgi:hypothetical protein